MSYDITPSAIAAASSKDICSVVYKTAPTSSVDPSNSTLVEVLGSYGPDGVFHWGSIQPLTTVHPAPSVFATTHALIPTERHLFFGTPTAGVLHLHTAHTTSGVWSAPRALHYATGHPVVARADSPLAAVVWKRAVHVFFVDAAHDLVDLVAAGNDTWVRAAGVVAPRIMRGAGVALGRRRHGVVLVFQYWDGSVCVAEAEYETWSLRRVLRGTEVDAVSALAVVGGTVFYGLTVDGVRGWYSRGVGGKRGELARRVEGCVGVCGMVALDVGGIDGARLLVVESVGGKARLVERMETAGGEWVVTEGFGTAWHVAPDAECE